MQWIETKDRLPNKGDFVLGWDGDGMCMVEYNGNYFGLSVNGQDYMISATHWMPLPEPPTKLPLESIMEKEAREKALNETLELIGLKPDAKSQRVRAFKNLFIAGWSAAMDYRTKGNIKQQIQADPTDSLT